MSNITLESNVKLITSGNQPTTANLFPGELAFGEVDSSYSLFGNLGGSSVGKVVKLNSNDGNSSNVLPLSHINVRVRDTITTARQWGSFEWSPANANSPINIAGSSTEATHGGIFWRTDSQHVSGLVMNAGPLQELRYLTSSNNGTNYTQLNLRNAGQLFNTGVLPVARGGTNASAIAGAGGAVANLFPTGLASHAPASIHILGITTSFAQTGWLGLQQLRERAGLGNTLAAVPVANGGTGLAASPSILINLGVTTAANVMQASPRPGVTGTLGLGNGGTGQTTLAALKTSLNSVAWTNQYQSNVAAPATGITTANAVGAQLQLGLATANGSWICFHRAGFAFHLGTDATVNDLCVGGFSMGANRHRVYHQGNAAALLAALPNI